MSDSILEVLLELEQEENELLLMAQEELYTRRYIRAMTKIMKEKLEFDKKKEEENRRQALIKQFALELNVRSQ